ncbi:YrhK family protein [Sedimentitalea sp. JM2-8]|uniref:YrhK family protein n=1 Tax=Sedimentitalea xiamensis TaxID=3050037 RepID=A0ABT7FAZ3_9RHOB|nr:YrhK family protein [Sedimentitalea xiamensis]MDK3072014.1 YrhK family protein [Sedimentitalea xiamensis]
MFFSPDNRSRSARHLRLYAYFELAYTVTDFCAAALFLAGSLLFFSEATTYAATWLFVIGSVLFGARPSIKLVRELIYMRMGDYEDVAQSLK